MFMITLKLWPLFVAVLAIGVIGWQRSQIEALRLQLRRMQLAEGVERTRAKQSETLMAAALDPGMGVAPGMRRALGWYLQQHSD